MSDNRKIEIRADDLARLIRYAEMGAQGFMEPARTTAMWHIGAAEYLLEPPLVASSSGVPGENERPPTNE